MKDLPKIETLYIGRIDVKIFRHVWYFIIDFVPNENQVLVLQDVHGALPRAEQDLFLGKDGVLLNFQKDVGMRNIL